MQEETKYLELLAGYMSGNISPEEQKVLLDWVDADIGNKKFFDETVQLWNISGDYEEPDFETDVAQAWNKVEPQLSKEEKSSIPKSAKVVPLSNFRSILRIAVVALLLITAGWWLVQNVFQGAEPTMIAFQTGEQEKEEVILPDGSKVWLNENSLLSYNEDFEIRIVQMEGEAFFDVEQLDEKPFVIHSGGARATVLGTTFNVRAYPNESKIEVTVETGKVALAPMNDDEGQSVVLAAGNSGVFDKTEEKVEQEEATISNAASWKTHRLEYSRTPLDQVIQSLERHFEVSFEIPNENIFSGNCEFNATFDQPKLEEVLKILEYAMNLQIEKSENSVILTGEGCE